CGSASGRIRTSQTMKNYKAHWSTSLVVISSLATVLCLGITLYMVGYFHGWLRWEGFLPLSIILISALFTIRGYTVTPDAILVHRLCWTTRVPLAGLESVQVEPEAMRDSIRTFGNGGLFSFTGCFRNKPLGAYRAYVTDPHQTVVLRFPKRTVVVSPATPQEFVDEI